MAMITRQLFGVLAGLLLLVGCGSPIDETQPGSCSLDCSNRKPAPFNSDVERNGDVAGVGRTEIQLITDTNSDLSCQGLGDPGDSFEAAGPIMVRAVVLNQQRRVARPMGPFYPESNPDNESAYQETVQVPMAGISFEPLIAAPQNLSPDRTSSEFLGTDADGNRVVSPFRFRGVVTPPSEWCSDSCGVMTYEVWPLCFNGLQISTTLEFISGAVKSDRALTLNSSG